MSPEHEAALHPTAVRPYGFADRGRQCVVWALVVALGEFSFAVLTSCFKDVRHENV